MLMTPMGWTTVQLHDYVARRAAAAPQHSQGAEPQAPVPAFAMRPTADEAKLNTTERRYLARLRDPGHQMEPHEWVGVQCITLKLADDTRYTPDFWTLTRGALVAHEVKGGFTRDDAWVKLKVAARLYPFIRFCIARYEKGGWEVKDISP